MFSFRKTEKNFEQIPLDIKGKLFVSPMPYGPYDPGNGLLKTYKKNKVEFAIMLVTDEELEKKAKRNLLKIYEKNGIQTIRFPISDYTSPELHSFSKTVDQVAGYLRAGASMTIHCNAGVGRTGVMACCIVRDILQLNAAEAIAYVRQSMQTKLTDEQMRLVERFLPLAQRISI